MSQYLQRMKKQIILNYSAIKELDTFSIEIKARFNDLFQILGKEGKLEMPFAKKLDTNLFEIRIKHKGQWRATYAYILKDKIIILSVFLKKTKKTPKKEIAKALRRL